MKSMDGTVSLFPVLRPKWPPWNEYELSRKRLPWTACYQFHPHVYWFSEKPLSRWVMNTDGCLKSLLNRSSIRLGGFPARSPFIRIFDSMIVGRPFPILFKTFTYPNSSLAVLQTGPPKFEIPMGGETGLIKRQEWPISPLCGVGATLENKPEFPLLRACLSLVNWGYCVVIVHTLPIRSEPSLSPPRLTTKEGATQQKE